MWDLKLNTSWRTNSDQAHWSTLWRRILSLWWWGRMENCKNWLKIFTRKPLEPFLDNKSLNATDWAHLSCCLHWTEFTTHQKRENSRRIAYIKECCFTLWANNCWSRSSDMQGSYQWAEELPQAPTKLDLKAEPECLSCQQPPKLPMEACPKAKSLISWLKPSKPSWLMSTYSNWKDTKWVTNCPKSTLRNLNWLSLNSSLSNPWKESPFTTPF